MRPRSADRPGRGRRPAGVAATIGIVAFVGGVPLLLRAIGGVPWPERIIASLSESALSSAGPIHLLELVLLVAWACWAVFAIQLTGELIRLIRGVRPPHVPQRRRWAAALVATAALAFTAAPAGAVAAVPDAGTMPVQTVLDFDVLGTVLVSSVVAQLARRDHWDPWPMPMPVAPDEVGRTGALDQALRSLAHHCGRVGQPLPRLRCVVLRERHVVLHLHPPRRLPEPWRDLGGGRRWAIALQDVPASGADRPAPYPGLLTAGYRAGHDGRDQVLLDLAQIPTLFVEPFGGFARAAVIELASAPWAGDVRVTGTGPESAVGPDRAPGGWLLPEVGYQRLSGGRGPGDPADDAPGWFRHHVIIGGSGTGFRGQDRRSPTRSGGGTTAILPGPGPGWQLTGAPPLLLPLGVAVRPQSLSVDSYREILDLLEAGRLPTAAGRGAT